MRRSAYWRRAEGGGLRLLSPTGDELGTLRRRGYQRYEVEVGLDSDLIGRVAGVKLSSAPFSPSGVVLDRETAIVAALDAIEANPPPCLADPLCNCAICARYCALWGRLDAERDEPSSRLADAPLDASGVLVARHDASDAVAAERDAASVALQEASEPDGRDRHEPVIGEPIH